MAAKRLLELSKEEQQEFLDSFDTVFCDIDGVLWDLGLGSIDGAPDGIKALRNLGKKMYFVSNNSTVAVDAYLTRLQKFEVVKEELVRPSKALIWYLKKINFDKVLYVVGFMALKDELKEAGFKVVYEEVALMGETAEAVLARVRDLRPDVGAVIIDFAVNVDYMGLQKCIEYITRNDALFFVGAWDPIVPYRGSKFIGCSLFANIIEEITGKAPQILSKPGQEFQEYIEDNIGPLDLQRILFIGDSPVTDMKFATNYGYQKLLVLTGYATEEDLRNWKYGENCKPDYVADSIKAFDTITKNLGLDKPKL